mmetsp:Transcript_39940/g.72378  ORF Transcript_39940/g.72378 Transcript_39940/m.72378 type:complete len:281 (+) Transcript_39940:294-1136(+)
MFRLLVMHLGTELEHGGGDHPHCREHALQWPNRQVCDDTGQREAAEDHDENDEDHGGNRKRSLQLSVMVHVELNHHGFRMHHHRGGHSRRTLTICWTPVCHHRSVDRECIAGEGARCITPGAQARLKWPIVVAGVEYTHHVELNHDISHPVILNICREPVDPRLQRIICLWEGPNVEQRNDHHKDDRQACNTGSQQICELSGDDGGNASLLCLLFRLAAGKERQEAENPKDPGQPPSPRTNLGRSSSPEEHEILLGIPIISDVGWLIGRGASHEGNVKDH